MKTNKFSLPVSLIVIFLCGGLLSLKAQVISTPSEKVKKTYRPPVDNKNNTKINYNELNKDSIIRIKLVKLALDNPAMNMADASARIAREDLKRARTSWLSSLSVGSNVNEFVIQNSAAANFFPKYNIGILVPLDIVTRTKHDKAVAKENIVIAGELKKDKERAIKAETLIRYENYLEKREKVSIQRTYLEYNFSAYEGAQHDYANGDITLDAMNRAYQTYLSEKSNLISLEKEFNISVIQLEEMIGQPLEQAMELP